MPQRPKTEPSGPELVGTCDWCKLQVKYDGKLWRGLLFHSQCYEYAKKGFSERKVIWPERSWKDKPAGEQISLEEEKRRIEILGRGEDASIGGDDAAALREGRDSS